MLRKGFTYSFAVLAILIYCTALIGIDVHSCSRSGRSFVVSLLNGTSCDDIHPVAEHHKDCCSNCSCAKEKAGDKYTDDCCSDSFHILEITGEDGSSQKQLCKFLQSSFALVVAPISHIAPLSAAFSEFLYTEDSLPPNRLLRLFCVFRI